MKIAVINCKDRALAEVIRRAVKDTLRAEGQPRNLEVSVRLMSADEIHQLNQATRGVDRPTDVLSYPFLNIVAGEKVPQSALIESSFDGKNIYLGDCALCIEVAARQAMEFGVTQEYEVRKLITHSILHLCGYDHIKDSDFEKMHAREKEILNCDD